MLVKKQNEIPVDRCRQAHKRSIERNKHSLAKIETSQQSKQPSLHMKERSQSFA